jgi:anti-anti-sigma factor
MSQILIEELDKYVIFDLKGQFIGGQETDYLKSAIAEIFNKDNSKAIVLNLEKATYLNSTALGVLINAHNNATRVNSKIILAGVGKQLENIFTITKLNTIFKMAANNEEAIKIINI